MLGHRQLLFLLVLAAAGAEASRWARVFNSFFERSGPPEVPTWMKSANNYYELPREPIATRVKRSVLAAIQGNACTAGWTGQFCENPLCVEQAPVLTPQLGSKAIDILYLPSGCTGTWFVPIDSLARIVTISVSLSDAVGYVNLTDFQNRVVLPTVSQAQLGFSLYRYETFVPGPFTITVNTGGTATSYCVVHVEATSEADVENGFVESPHGDISRNGESGTNGLNQYIIIQPYGFPAAATTEVVTISYSQETYPLYRAKLTKRYQCNYPYYAGHFQCSATNSYKYVVDGIDANGYQWRRQKGFGCLNQVTQPTQPPATTTPPGGCFNGGTLLNSGTVNASCFCSEYFAGTQCELANCMNGGTRAPGGISCICPDGYSGGNCQDVNCYNPVTPYLTDSQSLIVVVRNTASVAPYITTIATAVDAVYNSYPTSVYQSFLLVTFANGDYGPQLFTAAQYSQFQTALRALSTTTTVGNCNDTVIGATATVFDQLVYNKSPILVFTDVPASDYDDWRSIVDSNAIRKFPIYTFWLNTTSTCTVNPFDPGVRILGQISRYTGGLLFYPPTTTTLGAAVQYTARATTYQMNQVLMDDLSACSMPTYRTFFADSSATGIIILATGDGLTVTVTDPNWNILTPQPMLTQGGYIWEIPGNPTIGEYLFSVSSSQQTNPCSYRIQLQSRYDLFVATSGSPVEDAGFSEPVVGIPRHIVAQVTGYQNEFIDHQRLFAEITIHSQENQGGSGFTPLYYSSGKYRSGCGFHLYFGLANFCTYNEQPFYATIYVDDQRGYTIQRTAVGFCAGVDVTQSPPGTCQNGGAPDPTNQTACICPPNYSGTYCSQIICQNGGTAVAGGYCQCAQGTAGTFCENYACLSTQSGLQFNYLYRSLAFVFSTLTSMQNTLNNIANNAPEFVRDLQSHHPQWITRYIVAYANQTNFGVLRATYSPSDFVSAIVALAQTYPAQQDPTNTNCTIMAESAINAALTESYTDGYVITWLDSDLQYESVYMQLIGQAQQKRTPIYFVATNNTVCGNPSGTIAAYGAELASFTGGATYQTENVVQMLFFFTSLYESGVAADYYSPNCSAASPATYFLPIDGWASSWTLAVGGSNINTAVFYPDGSNTSNNDAYTYPLVTDPNFSITQFIARCDLRWNTRFQYCYLLEPNSLTWLQASQTCHSQGGILADIFTQDKQDFINHEGQGTDFWIGLQRVGDTWYWDVPDGASPAPLGNFTYWDANQPDPDTNKNCVRIDRVTGMWVADNCSASNFFVCQKHRYGQGYYPGELGVNLVPPGYYKIQVTADGACSFQARVQSSIQTFFGFTENPRDDFPSRTANIASTSNYVTAHVTGLSPYNPDTNPSNEGRLNYGFLGLNSSSIVPINFYNRQYCSYFMVSNNFTCIQFGNGDPQGQFFIKFSGIDQYGFLFERISTTQCTTKVITCNNGGTVFNGACVCAPGYTGPSCDQILCVNGGVSIDGRCRCEPEFTGAFCQLAMCIPPYPTTFTDENRTLVVILETSYGMSSTIYMLRRRLLDILMTILAPGQATQFWFQKFILYPFDSTSNEQYWYPILVTLNASDIITAMNNISIGQCPGPNGQSQTCASGDACPRPILRVLNNTLSNPDLASPNSQILIVTRSGALDYSLYNQVLPQIQNLRAQINIVLPGITSPCGMGFNIPEAGVLYNIASVSGGNIFLLNPTELATNFLQVYLPSLYRSAALDTAAQSRACDVQEIYIQVDSSAYEFTIDFYANTPTITLINPLGDTIPNPASLISSATNVLYVYPVNDTGSTIPGTYRIVAKGGGGSNCYLNIRGRSNIEVYPAYTQIADAFNGATQDDAHHAPVFGSFGVENNVVIAHVEGLTVGRLAYVQAVGFGNLFYTSEFRPRANCSYEYYSARAFECLYERFDVIIYGYDNNGYAFRRSFTTHCIFDRPPPPPPQATCDLSATLQDYVFILDSSAAAQGNFSDLIAYIGDTIKDYNIGPATTQAALITVSDTYRSVFQLNQYTSVFDLVNNLTTVSADGNTGQNLASALNYVVANLSTSAGGYRANISIRHQIIYVGASNNFTGDDPVTVVNSIRRSGLYGVAVVTLGITNPTYVLTEIGGGRCYYSAADVNDLRTNGINFIQFQSCLPTPFCAQ